MARRRPSDRPPVEADITALSAEGRGIAHVEGKVTFVDGALPGERVRLRYTRRFGRRDEGVAIEVLRAAPGRVEPRCPHYGVCGGCSLQHLAHPEQVAHKQGVVLEQLRQFGAVEPERVLEPLVDSPWGYRRRARLKVRHVVKKGGVLVGFTEREKPYVAEMSRCEVLDARVGLRIEALRELVQRLSLRDRIAQIEVSIGDEVVGLLLRHLAPFSAEDLAELRTFAEREAVQLYAQPGGPDSIHALWPDPPAPLAYRIDAGEVEIRFEPNEFTQVNAGINARLVERVMALLAPTPEDRVLDLFCGLGNFTLPIARRAAAVLGVEGEARLVGHARDNARRNGLEHARFECLDLAQPEQAARLDAERFDLALIDPPRTGAEVAIAHLRFEGVRRLVYVSCNPATLGRDAGVLVREKGFRLAAAGAVDMFPHTAHTEAVAVFERG